MGDINTNIREIIAGLTEEEGGEGRERHVIEGDYVGSFYTIQNCMPPFLAAL